MEFLNYCKNHFKYKIFKILLYFIIGIILIALSGFINIATVNASDYICETQDNEYDPTRMFLSIYEEHEDAPNTMYYEVIPRVYEEALDMFLNGFAWSSYVVSLQVYGDFANDLQATKFAFTFYSSPIGTYYDSSTNNYGVLWYKKSIIYNYELIDGIYTFTSTGGAPYYSGSSYNQNNYYQITGSTCKVNPLLLFAGNADLNMFNPNLSGDVLVPVYGFEYTHQALGLGSTAPYVSEAIMPEIEQKNLVELSLDVAPWLVLYLKDYEETEPFTSNMYFKGMVCPQPIYEYGTAVKENFAERCTVDLSNYTKKEFEVLESDIENNAVYYFKGYKEGASIKINPNHFNYKYIYDEENPTLEIDGTTYNILRYNSEDIPGNAIENENNNLAPGESSNFFDNILDGIKAIFRSISSFFESFFNKLGDLFVSIFVPEELYFKKWFADLKAYMEDQLGFLSAPITIVIDFINHYLNLDTSKDIIINIPDITVPNFEDNVIIKATSLNWTELLNSKESLKNLWLLYLDFIDVFLILNFIRLCEKVYARIFGGDASNYEYYTVEDSYTYDNNTGEVKSAKRKEKTSTRKRVA